MWPTSWAGSVLESYPCGWYTSACVHTFMYFHTLVAHDVHTDRYACARKCIQSQHEHSKCQHNRSLTVSAPLPSSPPSSFHSFSCRPLFPLSLDLSLSLSSAPSFPYPLFPLSLPPSRSLARTPTHLQECRRTASVTSKTFCQLFVLTKDDLFDVMSHFPGLQTHLNVNLQT